MRLAFLSRVKVILLADLGDTKDARRIPGAAMRVCRFCEQKEQLHHGDTQRHPHWVATQIIDDKVVKATAKAFLIPVVLSLNAIFAFC